MKTRKLISLILAVILLLPAAIMPVSAASGVPQEVLDARESVVFIALLYKGEIYSSGTGFAVESNSDETIIVTNCHVVEDYILDSENLTLSVYIGSDNYVNGKIIDISSKDMCLISVPANINLPKVTIRTQNVNVGDAVYAVGFPRTTKKASTTRPMTANESTITDGIISAMHDSTSAYNDTCSAIEHTATITYGNSGGPLFDSSGNVIGINTLMVDDTRTDDDKVTSVAHIAIHTKELKSFASQNGIKLTEGKLKEEPAPTTQPAPPPTTQPKPVPTTAPPVTESPVVESESNGMPGWVWGAIVLVIAVSAVLIVLGIKKQEERRKEEERRREEEQRRRGQSLFTAPENDKKLIFNDKKTKNESGLIFNDKKKKNHFSSDMDDLS